MKRARGLFPRIVTFENLHLASRKARRGRRWKADVRQFEFNLEPELLRLQEELSTGRYMPGPYTEFVVREPKERLIHAASYRDRIVHHAIMNVLEPELERRMISDSFACRPGKGSHRAVLLCNRFARAHRYVLRCDIRKYFPSIDRGILKETIKGVVKDNLLLALLERIIDAGPGQDSSPAYFPGDDLFTHLERPRGIPIGNLTSQWFANYFLNGFDHWAKRDLAVGPYLRYMDNFLLFSDSKAVLRKWREAVTDQLASLRLRLNDRQTLASRCRDGIPFLGFRVFPGFRLLIYKNKVRQRRRLKRLSMEYGMRVIGVEDLRQSVVSWIGHASWANTYRLRVKLFEEVAFKRAMD